MKETMVPPPAINSIAVTYRCSDGHHDVRFYREGPIARTVSCTICGWPATISKDEYARHAKLLTPLNSWVA
jgi:hypothetical protein